MKKCSETKYLWQVYVPHPPVETETSPSPQLSDSSGSPAPDGTTEKVNFDVFMDVLGVCEKKELKEKLINVSVNRQH